METVNIDNPRQVLRNVRVGKNVRIFDFVNAYECDIDDGTKIGAFVEIQKNAFIGKNCKISSHSFICEGVHIEDNVFIGHNVTFINDKYPRSTNPEGSLQTDADWKVEKTYIKKGASIGSSTTILCGITIGENAMTGAGSVVTKDVPSNALVAGNPAKIIRQLKTEK
jgi:UDP-2-acetamido-3-amino-2,3-dideoxy-glucuronate N-acetyltransferase